ncbi:tyrosine-type recombinase/integrase [Nitratireductor aquimarinus]|uniref:tyrosine-type recombinase/integrase n=1 Tax=Nitratireductor aquimarinus TaxID=889300 RepID=UPI001A8F5C36|nr:tyrosine-type recombinase/integrase [Nitratireductor aquimarinus]MBN8241744.1 tyrosine-type recombinase/integrase [Nitratireductor aquimarinus]MBY6130130.1 tyrosine-type recombinase/integrase [Nitratireductor aquimarinus]MCA1304258.1 tyrosine-type recombinase/integrase [Nitratireductor aquimarinus]
MLVRIKGVHKVKSKLADGTIKEYYYAWRGGPKMSSNPHTEEFALEYAKLKAEAAPRTVDTIETLVANFKGKDEKNPDWLALAETTRRDYEYAFKLILKEWPHMPVKLTQQKGMKASIRKWHRSFASNPRKADKLLFALSKLFSYAVADEIIDKNPCTGIERIYSGSRRDAVWTPEKIATFRNGAPAHLLLPFEIAVGTGQRQGDILSLTRADYDGVYLRFAQSKSGKKLKVRVHARLKALLDALPEDEVPTINKHICLNSRQRPWSKDGFKTSWGKECARLGIKGVTFHDLRGTFITDRRREGSSVEQIASISGHSTSEVKTVLEKHYLADDQAMSDAVILRMERTQRKRKK